LGLSAQGEDRSRNSRTRGNNRGEGRVSALPPFRRRSTWTDTTHAFAQSRRLQNTTSPISSRSWANSSQYRNSAAASRKNFSARDARPWQRHASSAAQCSTNWHRPTLRTTREGQTMGDRALLIFTDNTDVSPVIYLHWHGSQVPELLRQHKDLMASRGADVQ